MLVAHSYANIPVGIDCRYSPKTARIDVMVSVLSISLSLFASLPVAARIENPPPVGEATQPIKAVASDSADEAAQVEEAVQLILGENELKTRQIGVRTLLRIGSTRALDRLATLLADAGQANAVACTAICAELALSDSPPRELLKPLVNLIGNPKSATNDHVRAALSAYPLQEAQRMLCEFAGDASETIPRRVAIIKMIGRLGDDYAAAAVLAARLNDSDPAIRTAALSAFGDMNGIAFEDAAAASEWWRSSAGLGELRWLASSNQRRRKELESARSKNRSLVARLIVAYRSSFLSLPENEQAGQLVAFLGDDESDIRSLGLDLIAAMVIDQKEVSKEVRAGVMILLADPIADLRRRAAIIAGDLQIVGAADVLIASLQSEKHPRVRAAIAGALGRLDDDRAIQPLVGCLASEEQDLIAEATMSLGSLARRGQADPDVTKLVVTSLEDRFAKLAPDDVELREKFIRAMARIGAESSRGIFERESSAMRPAATRIAAIAGLATYENGGAAEFLIGLLVDEDPLIRGTALQGLRRCGRTVQHFNVLIERTEPGREPDSAVREKAWDAAQAMFSRLAADVKLQIVKSDQPSEGQGSQKRRAALARSLKADRDVANQLTTSDRTQIAMVLADALFQSGDTAAALVEWRELASRRVELTPEDAARVDEGMVRGSMRVGDVGAAISAAGAGLRATPPEADRDAKQRLMRQWIDSEMTSHLASVQSAEAIASLFMLTDPNFGASTLGGGDEVASLQAAWTRRIEDRRNVLIDSLLDEKTSEASVAEKLKTFPKDAVIGRIHERLSSIKQTTSGPASDREAALIRMARQLSPEWPGYAPGTSVEERSKALKKLISG